MAPPLRPPLFKELDPGLGVKRADTIILMKKKDQNNGELINAYIKN